MLAIRWLRAVDRALRVIETAGVTAALLIMVTLSFAQVVLRNAHIAALPPVPWIPLVAQHLVLWVGMLGASLAAGERRHIAIEVISKAVTPQGRRVVEGIVDLAVIVICVLLAVVSWKYVTFLERPEKHAIVQLGGVKILTWWSFTILPVGFALIAFKYFHLLVERIFVDEPVKTELEAEVDEFDRRHSSDERSAIAPSAEGTP
jgi:TRAP-type C4-dicarboxylate transport system permease small subunit